MFRQTTHATSCRPAELLIASLPSCLMPEIAQTGNFLRCWLIACFAYSETDGVINGGTETTRWSFNPAVALPSAFTVSSTIASECSLSTAGPLPPPHPTLKGQQ